MSTLKVGADGFLIPGSVIKYYREQMTYTDAHGIVKHWTQADVARHLGVSEQMVGLMETKNQGLDSIERRRTLAALLNIPLALLGLASLDEQRKIIQPGKEPTRKEIVDTSEIQLYQSAFPFFKEQYEQGNLTLQTIETWIKRINISREYWHEKQDDILEQLSKYHLLAAKTYYTNLRLWKLALDHLNLSKEVASSLKNKELLAVTYYHFSDMFRVQQKFDLACNEIDCALNICNKVNMPKHIRGNILADSALTRALIISDEADRLYVQQLLDNAERCITNGNSGSDILTFDTVQYLEIRADTLISAKRYALALECIDDAEEYNIIRPRNNEYFKLLRVKCYINKKKPEYGEAVRLLSELLTTNQHIQYYVNYVARLHKLIAASPYGNSPDAVDLGMRLRELSSK